MLHTETLGVGPRIVLVHGFTQTGRSWATVATGLARDHEVVLVDAPGHGGSAAVRADLLEGAELLGQAGAVGTYVGYSMGGRLALHLALSRPQLVSCLVLIGATAGVEDDAARAARRDTDAALATALEREGLDAFLQQWLAQPLFASLPSRAAGLDDRRRNTVDGLAWSLRSCGTGAQQPLWDRLGSLAMPVLVMAGEHDERFTAIGRRMVQAMGDNATFVPVPGTGHAAHLEQPEVFVELLRAWLAGVNVARGR